MEMGSNLQGSLTSMVLGQACSSTTTGATLQSWGCSHLDALARSVDADEKLSGDADVALPCVRSRAARSNSCSTSGETGGMEKPLTTNSASFSANATAGTHLPSKLKASQRKLDNWFISKLGDIFW